MQMIKSRLFGGISLAVAVAGIASTTAAFSHSTFDAQPVTATTTSTATDSNSDSGLSESVISFTATNFYDYNPNNIADSVFVGTDSNDNNGASSSKTFGFTIASTDYTVTEVQLNVVSNGSTIGKASSSSTIVLQEHLPVTMTLTVTGTAGSVVISDTNSILNSGGSGVGLYFEVLWTKSGGNSGTSYSRSFAFYDPSADGGSAPSSVLAQFTNTSPVRSETTIGLATTIRSSATATTGTLSPTSTNDGTSISGSTKSSSSSGISKGAIAGIVVGAIAAITIIGALAFFFIRRRNNKEKRNAYNAALLSGSVEPYRGAGPVSDLGGPHANLHDGVGSGTAVNLMEKDALAGGVGAAAGHFASEREIGGPNSPNNPHSPYTDEDGTGTPQIIPSRNIATSSAAGSATATPVVSPVPAQAQPVSGTAAAAPAQPPATTTTAPAIRGQVAALIEDHMTPEDVARLEAEERELDADIENAIRNRAAASSRQG
ncbi:hypothetical protein SEUCBS140593_006615 [Sporothrix eucalyptigena]|uniref:Mid2 domain-containing protein n=1 Tax=Sporothrix eucalyptigena TaxID=1812306 RepID=A0ABP0C6A7_9PEZI